MKTWQKIVLARMSDADLEALWVFFKSLPPVPSDVIVTSYVKDG
jgi:hypothetical protein